MLTNHFLNLNIIFQFVFHTVLWKLVINMKTYILGNSHSKCANNTLRQIKSIPPLIHTIASSFWFQFMNVLYKSTNFRLLFFRSIFVVLKCRYKKRCLFKFMFCVFVFNCKKHFEKIMWKEKNVILYQYIIHKRN